MDLDSKKIFKTLNPNKIWIPVLLGLAIVFYIFYRDPNITFKTLQLLFDAKAVPVILAILVLLFRDVGYIYRIRIITNKELTWTSSIYVVILWEFASAVTPSVVGGTAVAVFILLKEGINLGKSLAYVMVTAILDNMFFVIAAPIILLLTKGNIFPAIAGVELRLGNSLQYIFFISYSLIAIYTIIMAFALFFRPRAFKWILMKVTNLRFLRKWKHAAYEHGNEVINASSLLRGRESSYWFKIITVTILIWSARYLMLNCLISAYASINFADHMMIFSRQIIMWILMLASPTPGSSGTAEFFFTQFFRLFLGDYTFITMIFWRMLSYYPYLILGAFFLPRWIKRVFFKKRSDI
ncbi:MAG: flippase-like domain-containing protein [Bacteroidota bacterium]|nr:flippase-like domain-containing protein [Bacteroidota bacterium]